MKTRQINSENTETAQIMKIANVVDPIARGVFGMIVTLVMSLPIARLLVMIPLPWAWAVRLGSWVGAYDDASVEKVYTLTMFGMALAIAGWLVWQCSQLLRKKRTGRTARTGHMA